MAYNLPNLIAGSGISISSSGSNETISSTVSSLSTAAYGDGSDGTQIFDGTTTILGLAPSGNTYTLTRDIFLSSSTINSGVSIITNGCRMFCSGTITNNGTIKWNGNPGTNTGTAGAALFGITITSGNLSQAGAVGNTGAGSSALTISNRFGGTAGGGGAGASAGGTGGTGTAPVVTVGSTRFFPFNTFGFTFSAGGSITPFTGGNGGGGGGGDGTDKGGGGGGGAGVVILNVALFSGTGTIEALGGAGGNGQVGGTNCGGGGGGGGGVVYITSRSVSSGSITGQTINVAGGDGGNPTGSGITGTSGNTGTTVILYM